MSHDPAPEPGAGSVDYHQLAEIARHGDAVRISATVARLIDDARAQVLAGRGPGISEQDWRRYTTDRPLVAGRSPAHWRELTHLHTLRARNETGELEREQNWAKPWLGTDDHRGRTPDRDDERHLPE